MARRVRRVRSAEATASTHAVSLSFQQSSVLASTSSHSSRPIKRTITDAELDRQKYVPELPTYGRSKPALRRSLAYHDCYIWKRDRCSDPTLLRPELLAVNKQVRVEASEIFYGKAMFRVPLALDLVGCFGVRMAQRWFNALMFVDRDFIKAIRAECMNDEFLGPVFEQEGEIHMFPDDGESMSKLALPVEDMDAEEGWRFRNAQRSSFEARGDVSCLFLGSSIHDLTRSDDRGPEQYAAKESFETEVNNIILQVYSSQQ